MTFKKLIERLERRHCPNPECAKEISFNGSPKTVTQHFPDERGWAIDGFTQPLWIAVTCGHCHKTCTPAECGIGGCKDPFLHRKALKINRRFLKARQVKRSKTKRGAREKNPASLEAV
jgi:hypothetical protein